MKLYLYKNSSDTKRLVKQLDLIETIESVLWKEDTDILHPTFTFHKFHDDQGNMIWKEFNYCMLEWSGVPNRYYFIDNLILTKGGIIEIKCSVDVRMTWATDILSRNFLVARQEHIHNKVMHDDRLALPMTKTVSSTEVGIVGDGGNGTIILTISG